MRPEDLRKLLANATGADEEEWARAVAVARYEGGDRAPETVRRYEGFRNADPEGCAELEKHVRVIRQQNGPAGEAALAERLLAAFRRGEEEEPSMETAGTAKVSVWEFVSAALRELLEPGLMIPTFGAARGCCATRETEAAVEFAYSADGSLQIRIVSCDPRDEGVELQAEIPPLPPRRLYLRRRAPAAFEVEGMLLLTADEQRQLPADRRLNLRVLAPEE